MGELASELPHVNTEKSDFSLWGWGEEAYKMLLGISEINAITKKACIKELKGDLFCLELLCCENTRVKQSCLQEMENWSV